MSELQGNTRSNLSAAQLSEATLAGLAERLGDAMRRHGWMLGTAESCTGGLLAGAMTSVAGSSDWFERGFVTYSNDAKVTELDVSPDALHHFGAVSEPVALEMANGVLLVAPAAHVAVSTTGIAGPGAPRRASRWAWCRLGLRCGWATASPAAPPPTCFLATVRKCVRPPWSLRYAACWNSWGLIRKSTHCVDGVPQALGGLAGGFAPVVAAAGVDDGAR